MKKILCVLFIALGFAVSVSAQTEAACKIVWSGDWSGEVSTNETSRTQQATMAAFDAIFGGLSGSWDGSCFGYSYDYSTAFYDNAGSFWVCIDGDWGRYTIQYRDPLCFMGCWWGGEWDVVCDSTTTTTEISTTTTTAEPTLITLASFTATASNREILIQWSTDSEINNAGFNIYRAESEKEGYIKINDALIPAQGSATQGSTYQFTDENVKNRKTYFYKLEDVDVNGTGTLHGPVNATPRLIYGVQ